MATWLNRALGRVFSDHGITVVPQLRWSDRRDCVHCFAGVERGSVVAVSNYGAWRDPILRQAFLLGLRPMVEAVQPSTVIVHGTVNPDLRREIGSTAAILHLPSHRDRLNREP